MPYGKNKNYPMDFEGAPFAMPTPDGGKDFSNYPGVDPFSGTMDFADVQHQVSMPVYPVEQPMDFSGMDTGLYGEFDGGDLNMGYNFGGGSGSYAPPPGAMDFGGYEGATPSFDFSGEEPVSGFDFGGGEGMSPRDFLAVQAMQAMKARGGQAGQSVGIPPMRTGAIGPAELPAKQEMPIDEEMLRRGRR